MDNLCRELYLELDTSALILIAESIQRLQTVYGKIGSVFGKGFSAKVINKYIDLTSLARVQFVFIFKSLGFKIGLEI